MATKKKGSSKRGATQAKNVNTAGRRQLMSVIWFTVAIFLLFVVFVKGENVWAWLHNFIFGLFGITAYFYPFLLGFVAVMFALDRINGSITAKIIESSLLVVFVGSAVDIFSKHDATFGFWEHLANAYTNGAALKSGGFIGALIGHPIYLGFGKTGAAITVILLIFVFFMIITGTTLMSLFNAIRKPVQKISEQAESAYQERLERDEIRHSGGKKLKVIKGFDVDIPVDDDEEVKPRKKPSDELNEQQRRVVSAYRGEAVEALETVSEPDGAEDKKKIKRALKATAEESKEIAPEDIDFKEETKKFTENLEEIDTATDDGYSFPPLSLLKVSDVTNPAAAAGAEVTAERL
ncbi:MAG: DNA translocase FtsK 4TM domain-containing protein, partial [Clostridia bacterium]|nr:DNA translocase FtsK 4TM domain-containing protein [Clostridia bacterium]